MANKQEQEGAELFNKIGLNCFYDFPQVKLNDITSGCKNEEHLEFDYLIPENNICLIGEITERNDDSDIRKKYDKFVKYINMIKQIYVAGDIELWHKLGIPEESLIHFKNVNSVQGFFITTEKERFNINFSNVEDVAIFYKSDFLRIKDYAERIGKWNKFYFLNNFSVEYPTNSGLTIYEKDNRLIKNTYAKISSEDTPFSELYTFTISPYKLLDIAHVYRSDEFPSLQNSNFNYQRPLDSNKLKEIRTKLLTNPNFLFPSNILVILSQKCEYKQDVEGNCYLYIPKKYGSISVIDGQHRLFSYADEKVQSIMRDDCQIIVTAVKCKSKNLEIINNFSAKIFIEININQTKVEISHLDKIAYELGSEDPKVLATKILITLNNRPKFKYFFEISSDVSHRGIVEAGTIIDAIKKITNLNKIKQLENPRSEKNKSKKVGFENLFEATVTELSDKDTLVGKSTILLEHYFSIIIFSTFKQDKPTGKNQPSKNQPKTSFLLSKFWGGWVNLLDIFLQEGLDWNSVNNEIKNIKSNIMQLRKMENYNDILFKPDEPVIPDSSHSPTKVCKFLNQNRQQPVSIQNIS
ncbi:DGQHR domain-containing protein [Nodularia sp. UHCC 0506]|uniref:DGQHR domain-containing protein n=1 Tax=Nodularia sp. UHCC 0506 TaxID=3110243 RepID=UPI002B20A6BD|nr:DGQHR domain-containing protein [Nodularia sp. UHCC 0506]MEA5515432.1 DGQHR domain-containing protein [Nodularia sp. UHCC 0506]